MKKNIVLLMLFLSSISINLFSDLQKKKRLLFIVNPISHEIKNISIQKEIEKNIDVQKFEYEIQYTKHPQHASQLAQDALVNSVDIIAVVGGDGTVNEVGAVLINTEVHLAIIPAGSGNGLARHLNIPLKFKDAIELLNYAKPILIDTAKLNNKTFLNTAGIGFDAHVAHLFAHLKKRGFFAYCQIIFKEFSSYKPRSYLITIDGRQILKKAYLLTLANSSQYGNNVIIAPQANISDGYLDLVIIDDVSVFSVTKLIYQLLNGSINNSSNYETYPFKELVIDHPDIPVHIDGEPLVFKNQINVSVQPKSLNILIP